jgi:hypothetical protein
VAAIWRKVREGSLSPLTAAKIVHEFKEHFRHQYRIVEVHEEIVEEAMALVEKYGLRGYDAVQLASAKWLNQRFLEVGLLRSFSLALTKICLLRLRQKVW